MLSSCSSVFNTSAGKWASLWQTIVGRNPKQAIVENLRHYLLNNEHVLVTFQSPIAENSLHETMLRAPQLAWLQEHRARIVRDLLEQTLLSHAHGSYFDLIDERLVHLEGYRWTISTLPGFRPDPALYHEKAEQNLEQLSVLFDKLLKLCAHPQHHDEINRDHQSLLFLTLTDDIANYSDLYQVLHVEDLMQLKPLLMRMQDPENRYALASTAA